MSSECSLLPLAQQIATHLGDGWHATHDDWRTLLTHIDGRELHIRGLTTHHQTGPPARLRISGLYPDGHGNGTHVYGLDRPSITVRADRGAKVIAAEIHRRLLLNYQSTLAVVRAQLTKWAVEQAARDDLTARLLAVLPGAHKGTEPAHEKATAIYWGPYRTTDGESLSGQAWFCGAAATVYLRASVPAHLAVQFLTLVVTDHTAAEETSR